MNILRNKSIVVRHIETFFWFLFSQFSKFATRRVKWALCNLFNNNCPRVLIMLANNHAIKIIVSNWRITSVFQTLFCITQNFVLHKSKITRNSRWQSTLRKIIELIIFSARGFGSRKGWTSRSISHYFMISARFILWYCSYLRGLVRADKFIVRRSNRLNILIVLRSDRFPRIITASITIGLIRGRSSFGFNWRKNFQSGFNGLSNWLD